jgi:hypothetical protein
MTLNTKCIKNIKIISVAILSIGLIGGCSGVSKKSCNQTNWKEQGISDGKKGLAAEGILKTEKSCASKGSEFPITEYKDGWMEGIAVYCSPENGFNMAKEGKTLNINNCPIEFRPALEQNIKLGKEFAGVESKIKDLQKQKESMKDDRQDVKEKITEIEKELNTLESKRSDITVMPATGSSPAADPVQKKSKK